MLPATNLSLRDSPPDFHHLSARQRPFLSSPMPGLADNAPRPSSSRTYTDWSRSNVRGDSPQQGPSLRSNSIPDMRVTPEEFNSLPASIQKKYFSSVERLRIAQQSAILKRKKQHLQPATVRVSCLPNNASMDFTRPDSAQLTQASSLQQPRHSHASVRTKRSDADVDEEQAIRFLSLPDKVKRSHFSPEELFLLTESSERVLRSSFLLDDDNSSQRLTALRKGSVGSSVYRSAVSEDYYDDRVEKSWLDIEPEIVSGFDEEEEEEEEEHDPEKLKYDYRQRMDSASSLSDISSPPPLPPRRSMSSFLSNVPPPPSLPPLRSMSASMDHVPAQASHTFHSKRRAFSLTPIPLPPPKLTPAVTALPRIQSITIPSVDIMHPSDTILLKVSTTTKYYKDSDARQKVREFLASPEKFDEALEFGFPTEINIPECSTSLSSILEPSLQADAESDGMSMTHSRCDEDEIYANSPRTPSIIHDHLQPAVGTFSSADSGVAWPLHWNTSKSSEQDLSPDLLGREMTLRMTLTRPDLRAPEDELYAVQRKQVSGVDVETSDPLALESLSVCDDHSGAQGAFAVSKSSGGLRKVWKSIRKR